MKAILFSIFIFISCFSYAGDPTGKGDKAVTAAFSGKILDRSNAEALPGATITIEELGLTSYASFDGSFSFENLPLGTYTFKVSYISYDDAEVQNVEISAKGDSIKVFLESL